MTDIAGLDRERIRELFDLRQGGGGDDDQNIYRDPYPTYHRLRESGPVHEGPLAELMGWRAPGSTLGADPRRQFAVFDFATADQVFRDEVGFPSAPTAVDPTAGGGLQNSMLHMNGVPHRRYRAIVQPSFIPKKAEWWIARWIHDTANALIDGFESDGRAELNVDYDAAIPTLTITGSFGLPVEDALAVRTAAQGGFTGGLEALARFVMPIIAARREQPRDDLISVLCQAEMTDEAGPHRLSDEEIFSFSHLLLLAGSGTTWKQLGIVLTALLTRPELLEEVRRDRSLLRKAIEETMRWWPTDPVFNRYASVDVELAGVEIPAGSAIQVVLAAANRDPLRWQDPDTYDLERPSLPHLGFGDGPHLCIGQHVAHAEMHTAIDALLTRFPNLRLDPEAEAPEIIGVIEGRGGAFEMGPSELNVRWD